MKKTVFLTTFVVFNLLMLCIIYVNFPNEIAFNCPLAQETYHISLGLFLLIIMIIAELAGVMYAIGLQENLAKMFSAYQRKSESISVKHEESTDKIKALEAKIETLEAALKSALDK